MKNFYVISFLASTLFVLGLFKVIENESSRFPAAFSSDEPFELHIQSMALDPVSRLQSLDHVYIRTTFNKQDQHEYLRAHPLTVQRGELFELDHTIEIKDSWIKDNSLEFKIELVRSTTLSPIVLRCATVSKNLDVYKRAYQCTIPGEPTPVLSYRLARRGSEPPMSLASK